MRFESVSIRWCINKSRPVWSGVSEVLLPSLGFLLSFYNLRLIVSFSEGQFF